MKLLLALAVRFKALGYFADALLLSFARGGKMGMGRNKLSSHIPVLGLRVYFQPEEPMKDEVRLDNTPSESGLLEE